MKKVKALASEGIPGEKAVSGEEIKLLARKGRERSVYIEASAIEYYGKPAWLISMINLTRLREAETNLFRLQNYLSSIIDSMPSLLVGVDAALAVTQWNRQAEQQTACLTDTVLGRPLFSVIPRLEPLAGQIRSAVVERQIYENVRLSHTMGELTCFEDVTIYPLLESGFDGAVIRMDDVTEKVRLEEMVIQSEKMLSIGGLAAGMAHEINNPLAGILQNVQLAKNRLTKDFPANIEAAEQAGTSMSAIRHFMEKRRIFDQLDNIDAAGGRAAEIVENMLSFAKKGRSKKRHDLSKVLKKAIDLAGSDYSLKKEYDFRSIKICCDFPSGTSQVLCEENKIIQVFFNLISNAAQALYTVRSARRELLLSFRIFEGEKEIQVEIEDNGPGMDDATRKRIFEPFFTTKEVNKGTGLGLSMAYFIVVKDHNGELAVDSSPEKGTTFIIRLPKS